MKYFFAEQVYLCMIINRSYFLNSWKFKFTFSLFNFNLINYERKPTLRLIVIIIAFDIPLRLKLFLSYPLKQFIFILNYLVYPNFAQNSKK